RCGRTAARTAPPPIDLWRVNADVFQLSGGSRPCSGGVRVIWLWRASAAGLVIAFCRDRVRLLPGTAALAAALLALAWLPAAPVDLHTLEIVSRSGVHVFSVELAVTDAERARGLMFRRELPEGQGMLFDFGRDQDIAMWMKNTFIPLDMVFITE